MSPDTKINSDSSKINVNEGTHKHPERKSGWLHEQSRGTNVFTRTQKSYKGGKWLQNTDQQKNEQKM